MIPVQLKAFCLGLEQCDRFREQIEHRVCVVQQYNVPVLGIPSKSLQEPTKSTHCCGPLTRANEVDSTQSAHDAFRTYFKWFGR